MRSIFILLCLVMVLAGCQGESQKAEPVQPAGSQESSPDSADTEPTGPDKDLEVLARLTNLEAELEELREILLIPGMAAGVVKDQELIWAEGFGYADLVNQVPVTADTPFHLASVTKPIAATVIMQLVEEGLLDLETPISEFGVQLESEGVVNSWHLLTHTSSGVPGAEHHYDGNRYGYLGRIAEAAAGQSFRDLLDERLLSPLGMKDTAPNLILCPKEGQADQTSGREANYQRVHQEMAKPYQVDQEFEVVDGDYQTVFSPAAGLISTVPDIARFDIALDRDELLLPKTKETMFEPLVSTYGDSEDLMYGLGWYVRNYEGTELLWHSGRWPPSISALYLKVPDQDLSFIVLANTPNLTTPFPLGHGDVMYSALAVSFFKNLVYPQIYDSDVPVIDWESDQAELVAALDQVEDESARSLLQRELLARRMALMSAGRMAEGYDLLVANNQVFGPVEGLAMYDDTAARQAPEGERVELSQAEVERLTGDYVLAELPDFLNPGDVPEALTISQIGELLVVCSELEDDGLVITPIASDRLRALGGPEGYIYFDVLMEGDTVSAISARLAEQIILTYVPAE